MKRSLSILLIFTVFFSISLPAHAEEKPTIAASGFILMEKDSLAVIAGENAHIPLAPASTTKIMTCLVVLEKCALDDIVTIPPAAVGIEGSSAYLRMGEQLTVKDLLLCLMLASANDAAVALAIHVAGTVDRFVHFMNEQADRLGLASAHFANPHGLYAADHKISAYDMAILTAYALQKEEFRTIVSSKTVTIGETESRRTLVNHNRLLFTLEGCIGVKTGYTIAAGRCLVSASTRLDTTLICVTFNCRNDWESHKQLYDYGFSSVKRLTFPGYTAVLPIAGKTETIEVYASDYSILSTSDGVLDYQIYCPHLLYPPFDRGEKVGFVLLSLDGKEIARLPIITAGNCQRPPSGSLLARLLRYIVSLFN